MTNSTLRSARYLLLFAPLAALDIIYRTLGAPDRILRWF